MCAGKDCYWMDYTVSDPKAERFDSLPTGFATGSVGFPPEFKEVPGPNGTIVSEPNPWYNAGLFPEMRRQFGDAALADGRSKYKRHRVRL